MGRENQLPFNGSIIIGAAEIAKVNLAVAVLIWLMIIPMLMKIDFAPLGEVRRHWRGIGVTLLDLSGFESGAALATVVGVLIEVPVMLSVVKIVNASRGCSCPIGSIRYNRSAR